MFRNKIKAGLLLAALAFSAPVFAEGGFKVPVHFNLELVDGVTNPESYSRFNRTVELEPGRHQIVVSFKDTFGGASDSQLVQASNPIVIDIMDLKKDQIITFEYNIPTTIEQAQRFSRTQKLTLIDKNTEKAIPKADASYFILASETGFTMMRDYRTELLTLNRLYAPTYVAGHERTMGMTDYGSPIIEATAASDLMSGNYQQNQVMSAPGLSSSQQSNMSTSSKKGNANGGVTFNQLVKLYNQADDATKLQFVKYVMSH
jgi:uncharacterized protein YccT (UPF0319 family)